jgi:cell pole-organizing protein PopZ
MNWRFVLPFAIVAVVALTVAGVATLRMGNEEIKNVVAVAPAQNQAPAQAVAPSPVVAVNNAPTVVSTADPVADIVGTIGSESAGDSAILASASTDAALVANDTSELSALTTTYDATTF